MFYAPALEIAYRNSCTSGMDRSVCTLACMHSHMHINKRAGRQRKSKFKNEIAHTHVMAFSPPRVGRWRSDMDCMKNNQCRSDRSRFSEASAVSSTNPFLNSSEAPGLEADDVGRV